MAQGSGDDEAMDVKLLVGSNCPNEQPAGEMLRRAFADAGAGDTAVHTVVVGAAEHAKQLGFAGSPAVLLDGADPVSSAEHSTGLACRMYTQPGGGPQGVMETGALVVVIRRAAAEPEAARAATLCQDRRCGAAEQRAAIDSAAGRR
jgi:hypothetical protein